MPELEKKDKYTKVSISLEDQSYSVIIGENIIKNICYFLSKYTKIKLTKVGIVTDSNVNKLYSEKLVEALKESNIDASVVVIDSGETSKDIKIVSEVSKELVKLGIDRQSFIIALGGGVVGDLAGFVASIFQRGIPYIQIPTTIVSQVDSSVGGKTGVNLSEGKNLLGSFYQPKLVLADVSTLYSLQDREFNEGFAEIIKHGAIADESIFDLINEVKDKNSNHLIELISKNVFIKAKVVEEDEKETLGCREILNFGHTIGHGIEAGMTYGKLLHGEAISLGLIAATRLSMEKLGFPKDQADKIFKTLKKYNLPTSFDKKIDIDLIYEIIKKDKKFNLGSIRFVLLKSIGEPVISYEVSKEDIIKAIEDLSKPILD